MACRHLIICLLYSFLLRFLSEILHSIHHFCHTTFQIFRIPHLTNNNLISRLPIRNLPTIKKYGCSTSDCLSVGMLIALNNVKNICNILFGIIIVYFLNWCMFSCKGIKYQCNVYFKKNFLQR